MSPLVLIGLGLALVAVLGGGSSSKQIGPFNEKHIRPVQGGYAFTPEGLVALKSFLASRKSVNYEKSLGLIDLTTQMAVQPPRDVLPLLQEYVRETVAPPAIVALVLPAWFGEPDSIEENISLMVVSGDELELLKRNFGIVVGTADELAKARFFQ